MWYEVHFVVVLGAKLWKNLHFLGLFEDSYSIHEGEMEKVQEGILRCFWQENDELVVDLWVGQMVWSRDRILAVKLLSEDYQGAEDVHNSKG